MKGIVPACIVRRFVSISAIVALLTSLAPVHALMSCHANSRRLACHRAAAAAHHECGMMHEEMTHAEMMHVKESPGQDDSSRQIAASDLSPACPMNCCLQFNPGSGALTVVRYGHSQRMMIEYTLQPTLVIFSANGFSSHTDRGPPLG